MAEKVEKYYWECLEKLDNMEHDWETSYNLLLT
jgi:hypothetical protein